MSTSKYSNKLEPVNIVPSEQWRLCYGRIFGVSRTHSYGRGLQTVHPQSCLLRLDFENPEDPVRALMIHSSRYTEETYRINNIAILLIIIVERHMMMRSHETGTTRVSPKKSSEHTYFLLWFSFALGFNFTSRLVFPQNPFNAYFDSLRSMVVLLGALLSGETATKIDPSLPWRRV